MIMFELSYEWDTGCFDELDLSEVAPERLSILTSIREEGRVVDCANYNLTPEEAVKLGEVLIEWGKFRG